MSTPIGDKGMTINEVYMTSNTKIAKELPKGLGAFFKKVLTHFILQFRAKILQDPLSKNLLETYESEHALSTSVEHKNIVKYKATILKLASTLEKDKTFEKEMDVLLDGIGWVEPRKKGESKSQEDQTNLSGVFGLNREPGNLSVSEEQAKQFRGTFETIHGEIAKKIFNYRQALAKSEFSPGEILRGVDKDSSEIKQAEKTLIEDMQKLREEHKGLLDPLLRMRAEKEEEKKIEGKKIY